MKKETLEALKALVAELAQLSNEYSIQDGAKQLLEELEKKSGDE